MSVGTYTITSAREGRTYTGKHGDLVVWLVKLKDTEAETPTAEFEVHKKPGNTPQPGDQVEVDRFAPGVHDGAAYVRIFAASQQSGSQPSGRGGGGGGDSKNFDRRPEHPRNEARMIHTSAHGASNVTPIINQAMALGIQPAPKDWDEYWALYDRIGERNARSYEKALRGTETPPAAPVQPQLNGGEVPADTEGLQPVGAPAPDGDDLPF